MRKATIPVVVVLVAIAACKGGSTGAVPAKECPDPCCGGQTSIDCAENPNVMCVEDAEPCTARVYGCMNGSFYLKSPAQLPPGCSEDDGGAEAGGGGLVLGDGNVIEPDDALGDGADAGPSSDAPADAATEAAGGG
jgi:hypothetical protein